MNLGPQEPAPLDICNCPACTARRRPFSSPLSSVEPSSRPDAAGAFAEALAAGAGVVLGAGAAFLLVTMVARACGLISADAES